jgi:hypothetical protein
LNQKLLKKLVEISTSGKTNHIVHPPTSSNAAQSHGGASSAKGEASLHKSHSMITVEFKPKSLHFNSRKQELMRIERENQLIARKIFSL